MSNAYTWGWNYFYQLGNNSREHESSPVAVAGNHTFYHLSIGGNYHGHALDGNGQAWSWGSGWNGELGENDVYGGESDSPIEIYGNYTFCRISAGPIHVLALGHDGEVWSWGSGTYGVLGNNSTSNQCTPVSVHGGHTFCRISAGYYVSFGIDKNGAAWAWGSGNGGALGDNTTASKLTPVAVCGGHTFCHIAGSGLGACAIDKNGQAWAWGSNGWAGRIGNNSNSDQSTPVAVCGGHTFCQIAAGLYTHLGIDKDGVLWAWGWNQRGELGNNSTTQKSTPVAVCGGHTFCAVLGADVNSFAVDNNGIMWSWGCGKGGALGHSHDVSYKTPVAICGANHTFCHVAGAFDAQFAIDKAGQAWSWGDSDWFGKLGTNASSFQCSTPLAVYGTHTFCHINSIYQHVLAIDKNGQAWGWGGSGQGRLGNNATVEKCTPVAVCGGHNFCRIGAGKYHSAAIDSAGAAWCWGNGSIGGLGNNATTCYSTPVAVCGGHTFCHIESGCNYFTVSIDNHGAAWAWGYNVYGHLGNNATVAKSTPVAVCGGHTFCRIAAGQYHVLAIDNHGALWAWGLNSNGQLGDNTTVSKRTPVAVCGGHTFRHIAGGFYHSLAIDKNGAAWGWGKNSHGEVGNNLERQNHLTPVAICGSHVFCRIGAGYCVSVAVDSSQNGWAWGYGGLGSLGNNAPANMLTPKQVIDPT